MEFVAALADESHPAHEEMMEWMDGEPFDPEDMQAEFVDIVLGRVRRARRGEWTQDEPES